MTSSRMILNLILVVQIIKSEDIGLIGYFDTDCPQGWSEYNKAYNRTILGSHSDLKMTGGSQTQKLSVKNLPEHYHYLFADYDYTVDTLSGNLKED